MKSEFSTLHELALSKGTKHADLLEEIRKDVLIEYYKKYPDHPKEVKVLVDTTTGKVSIMSAGKDVAPPEFATEAESIARKAIIAKLEAVPAKPRQVEVQPETKPQLIRKKGKVLPFLSQLIFFGYNSVFLLGLVLSFFGLLSIDFRTSLWETFREIGFFKSALLVSFVLIPPATVGFALKTNLRKRPRELAKLFFLLELPLLVVCLLPLSMSSQSTPAMWFFSFMLILLPLALYSFETKPSASSSWLLALNLGINEVVLFTVVYLTLLISFFTPLILGTIAKWIFGDFFFSIFRGGMSDYVVNFSISQIFGFLISILFGGLGLMLAAAVILLPFLIVFVIWKKTVSLYKQFSQSPLADLTNYLVISVAALYLVILGVTCYQRNPRDIIESLEQATESTTFEEREEQVEKLLPQKDKIRRVLLDTFQARSRYLWVKGDGDLARAYQDIFNLDEAFAGYLQDVFDNLAYPFVYQLKVSRNQTVAEDFEYVFGETLKETKTKTAAQGRVRLISRSIEIKTANNDSFGTVTIEEEYTNTTWQNQEVIYEFSLPNETVFTALKLGPQLEFDGLIAPKGAAQRTYEQQLVRRRDPALLEQTGPRQYRLRVFPIPPKNDRVILRGNNQRVQFSYIVAQTDQGFALPIYSLKSNILVNNATRKYYSLNGEKVKPSGKARFIKSPTSSFDPCLAADFQISAPIGSESAKLVSHQNEQYLQVDSCKILADKPQLNNIRDLKIALFYDVTHENSHYSPQLLKQTLAENSRFLEDNTLDLYLFNDLVSQRKTLKPKTLDEQFSVVHFGKSRPLAALEEFDTTYDLLVVISGQEEALTIKDFFPQLNYPVYLVHAKGIIPAYHQEFTTALIQAEGQVVDSFPEAINHYLVSRQLESNQALNHLKTAPFWSIILEPAETTKEEWPTPIINETEPFPYLANQAYLLNRFRQFEGDLLANVGFLDQAHAFTEQAHIVTPYSSLIALVNQQQIDELKRQSQDERRYKEGALRTAPTTGPIMDIAPSGQFESLAPGVFGPSLQILNLDTSSGPGISTLGGAQFSNGGGFSGLGVFSLRGLFIVVNGFLLVIGTTVFLILSIKKRKKLR